MGAAGAELFDQNGQPLGELAPGTVVVERAVGDRAPDDAPAARIHDGKRIRGYADKRLRPSSDKATPPRQPDPRLSNPIAGSG